MEVIEDLYGILGVPEDVADTELKKAYKKLAIELHPDRYVGKPDEQKDAQERFSKVSHAFNILKDKQQRADYDFERRIRSGIAETELEEVDAPPPPPMAEDDPKRALADRKYNEGVAYFKKDFRMAVDCLKEAIRLNPDNAQYHTMLGVAYMKQGWPTYALSELKTALKLAPRDPLAAKWLRTVEAEIKAEEELKAKKDKKKRGKKKDKNEKKAKKEKKTVENKFRKKKVSFWERLFGFLKRD